MTLHTIEPERATLHGQFSSHDLEPALTVDSGDTVSYRTLDVAWGMENHKEGDLPRAVSTEDGARRVELALGSEVRLWGFLGSWAGLY